MKDLLNFELDLSISGYIVEIKANEDLVEILISHCSKYWINFSTSIPTSLFVEKFNSFDNVLTLDDIYYFLVNGALNNMIEINDKHMILINNSISIQICSYNNLKKLDLLEELNLYSKLIENHEEELNHYLLRNEKFNELKSIFSRYS